MDKKWNFSMSKPFAIVIPLIGILITSVAIFTSCHVVNNIGDTHFDTEGTPLDTLDLFAPQRPTSVKLYIETSGSMNGFFRAHQANQFKETVWSVFSGLSALTNGEVYPMSNGGEIDPGVNIGQFRTKMNAGAFVSNSATHIPAMVHNILNNIDTAKNEVAVLVSDMKYSPVGQSQSSDVIQYQTQIRNVMMAHPNISVAFVCAKSEYLNANGSVAEEQSPYFYIIFGKSQNVAAIRNDISRWCEYTKSYIESGDMCMNYHTPSYTLEDIENGYSHPDYPNNVITSTETTDTCKFIVRVDMTGYPWRVVHPEALDNSFNAKATYGSSVDFQLLNGADHLVDNHAFKDDFKRLSYADFLVKVYNFAMDGEVIEWTFTNRPFDGLFTPNFNSIIQNPDERDLSGAYSFDKFIQGCFNARLNTFNESPVRILITPEN